MRTNRLLTLALFIVLCFALVPLALAFAQTVGGVPSPAPAAPSSPAGWKGLVALALNSFVVLGLVQLIKVKLPLIREAAPWALPILAVVLGPLVAMGQSALGSYLGAPVDLSPLVALFTGGAAVAANQVAKQIGT
jgi:hypothetical protein